MRTVSIRLSDLERASIPIGFVGENEHTQVRIDCMKLYEEYPSAAASLTVKPPKGDPYPGVVTRENDIVVWVVSDSDLIYEGNGEIQLSFVVGEVIAKSYIGRIKVSRSITPTGEIPDPLEDFLTEASAALTAIPETINTALAAAKESGEFDGEDGVSPTVAVTTITGGHRLTIIDAEQTQTVDVLDGVNGEDGDDGVGISKVEKTGTSGLVDTYTITYTNGNQTTFTVTNGKDGEDGDPGTPGHSPVLTSSKSGKVTTIYSDGVQLAQINDGQDGQGGDVIDDTSTALDKAWSASKVSSEFSTTNSALSAKYTKPDDGIPSTDLASGVQTSLGKADTAYQKPQTGIPATDIAEGVIPSVTVDDAFSTSSTNPVQNKVITAEINKIEDFTGDLDTDLGTHTITTETDLTNMTVGSATVQNVKYTITKTTINANGTATANSLRIAQDNISLDAGYYCFMIDHAITSSSYQLQLFSVTGNATLKAFTSSSASLEYYFTLDSTISARIRAYTANGGTVSDETHTVTLKKITKQTYENSVSYYLIGLGSTENEFFTNIEQGSIGGTDGQPIIGATRCRTTEYIGIDDFVMCDLTKYSNYDMFVFLYGSDKTFLERIPSAWSNTSYSHDSIITANANTKFIKVLFRRHNDATITNVDIADMQGVIYVKKSRSSIESLDAFRSREIRSHFDEQFNYIAYSQLTSNDAPANTAEHFIYCGKQVFTALKGDVRNTSDGGLIMCHDPGYTFDGNSKITTYNSSNKTLINTLTVAQCKALTFAEQYNSSDVHPTDFDTYVRICKMYGKIAFITVRDEAIDTVVAPNVIATLRKYRMLDRAIVNSFTYATLKKFREYDSNIMLSLVMNQNTAPTITTVDMVMDLGHCILNLFDVPLPSGSTLDGVLTTYDPVLQYAINNNVPIYEAQTTNSHTDTLLAHGITGSHMTVIPDYMT